MYSQEISVVRADAARSEKFRHVSSADISSVLMQAYVLNLLYSKNISLTSSSSSP
jgi:hypothetical protein